MTLPLEASERIAPEAEDSNLRNIDLKIERARKVAEAAATTLMTDGDAKINLSCLR